MGSFLINSIRWCQLISTTCSGTCYSWDWLPWFLIGLWIWPPRWLEFLTCTFCLLLCLGWCPWTSFWFRQDRLSNKLKLLGCRFIISWRCSAWECWPWFRPSSGRSMRRRRSSHDIIGYISHIINFWSLSSAFQRYCWFCLQGHLKSSTFSSVCF